MDALLLMQNACTSGLDLNRSSSSKPEDKLQILGEVGWGGVLAGCMGRLPLPCIMQTSEPKPLLWMPASRGWD